jgi:hypothetical protein
VDYLSAGPDQVQYSAVHQRVIDHQVGLLQTLECKQGQEARVARAHSHQPYSARFENCKIGLN